MVLRVLLIDGDDPEIASIAERLSGEPAVKVEPRVLPPDEADVALRAASGPVIAVVGLGADAETCLRLVEDLKPQLPHVHWLLASTDRNPQMILRALRAGADEFLPLPAPDAELLDCIARVRRKMVAVEKTGAIQSNGKLVAVFSPQGGVGCTTVATNLAVSFATRNRTTAIVDLVLQFGSVTSFLDLSPAFTIVDFAEKLERFDPMLLEGSLVEHPSGVRVLADPCRAEEADRITASEVTRILDTLVRSFELTIVDLPKEIDDSRFPALEKADLILFPIELDVPSMRRAQRALQFLERFGVSLSKVRLVLNRYLNDRLLGLETVESTLGRPSFWTLPNDYVTAHGAINQGVPVVQLNPGGVLAQSYEGLTQRVLEELGIAAPTPKADARSKKLGLIGRWVHGATRAASAR
ncbi:MAG: AAA family ATPase [Candidatus Binatia bacterium]